MKYTKLYLIVFTVMLSIIFSWYFYHACEINCKIDPNLINHVQAQIKNNQPTTTLIAVGDIMPGRTVESKILKYNDWLFPFRETHQVTSEGDIVFANLESPLIEGITTPADNMVFRADPKIIVGLKYGGFNLLSLANNHMKNQGKEGISNTIKTLSQADIYYTGAGSNIDQASKPAIMEINGISFGFLAYLDSSFVPDSYGADSTNAGSPFMDTNMLQKNIISLKKQVDVVIISMHAGIEYDDLPNQKQIDFAHAAIDAGASLVIGHHPHVVQPIEHYKNGLILYSLGNFIFDQSWSEKTREGAIAKITYTGTEIESLELIPVKIFDYSQPRLLSEGQGQEILKRMSDFTF